MTGITCDRGPNSLLAVLLAAILKLSDSRGIYVLRGEHETPEVNGEDEAEGMTLKKECHERFENETEAVQLWKDINVLFFNLPYGATIHHRNDPNAKPWICVHGGPVPSFESLKTWNAIDRANRKKLLRFALGADPIEDASYRGDFQNNGRTQRMGERVFDYCLEANNARGMLRGHGEAPVGFKEKWGGKVVTVTSNHKGGKVGCVLAVNDDLTLRRYDV